jgi:hypothetical protein
LHLAQEFNKALIFVLKHPEGPSKQAAIFMLERARRSLSVVRIFKEKVDPRKIENDIEVATAYVESALRFIHNVG